MENKVLIGVPTYGNFVFTKLTLEHIKKTTELDDILVIVGKPGDDQTVDYCAKSGIKYLTHGKNFGLPKSLNDLYKKVFYEGDYDYLVVVGNDVLPYWNAIDRLVEVASKYKLDWVTATPVPVSKFLDAVPQVKPLFHGGEKDVNFHSDSLDEWLGSYEFSKSRCKKIDITKYSIIGDSHNLTLFSRNVWNTIGYIDVNFYPAYFEDNDYARRAQLAKLSMVRIDCAIYFHFWSRTIHQGGMKKINDRYFPMNKKYYIEKWGGEPGKETFTTPFNGNRLQDGYASSLKIQFRKQEQQIINDWIRK